jgi:hypothetical protein
MNFLYLKDVGCNTGECLSCMNGGNCMKSGYCECIFGYTGSTCQTCLSKF